MRVLSCQHAILVQATPFPWIDLFLPLKGIIAGILFCCKRAEAELVYGLLYGIFGPSLTLFNTKTSFLVLLGILFPEKLSRLSVKAGGTLHFR